VLNGHADFIADRLAASLVFHIPSGSLGKSFWKAVNVSAAGYPEIVFSIWSRGKGGTRFTKPADFYYQVSFDNGTNSYLVPTWGGFNDVSIVPAGSPVTTLVFTVLHNDEDWIVLSAMNAVVDEYPLDLLNALQNDIAAASVALYPLGFPTGDTVTASAGDTTVTFSGNHDFLGKYRLVKFGSEMHVIEEWAEGTATFKGSWGGKAVASNQVAAPVYVQFPVSITLGEADLLLPIIALDGMHPEPVLKTSGVERFLDTFNLSGTVYERQEDMLLRFPILIDVEAQEYELLARANRIVRTFLAQGCTWVNARKHDFIFDQPTEPEKDAALKAAPNAEELRMSIKGRQFLSADGKRNLPDG
jgi:hypothetical protein